MSFAQKRQQILASLGLALAMALDRCPTRLREEEGDALTCGPWSSAIERGRAQTPETERERARGWTGPPAAAGPRGVGGGVLGRAQGKRKEGEGC